MPWDKDIFDLIKDAMTGRQTETFDLAPEVQRPYGMPTGPDIPDIPVSAQEAAETAGWSSPTASNVCQFTTEGLPRRRKRSNTVRSYRHNEPQQHRRKTGSGVSCWFLIAMAALFAFGSIPGCKPLVAGYLDPDTALTQTITPQAAPAQLAETPQAPQLNPVREAMIAVQVTATANRLLGEALDREIIAGNATIAAQITLDAAYQSAQIVSDQATQSAIETATAQPPQLTGTALSLASTQAALTPTAVANAGLIADAQAKASREQAERWAAPAKAMTADVIVPLVIVFGIVFTALAIAVPVGRSCAYSISLRAETEARERGYDVNALDTPQIAPIPPRVIEIKRGANLEYPEWAQRLGEARLASLASAMLRSEPLTFERWVGKGKPFTRTTFEHLQNGMVKSGMGRWLNEANHASGLEITDDGWQFFEQFER